MLARLLVALTLFVLSVAVAWQRGVTEPLVGAALFAVLSATLVHLLARMSRGPLLEFPGSDVADQRVVRFATIQTLTIVYLALAAGGLALLSIESPRHWIAGATFPLGIACFAAAGQREWSRTRRALATPSRLGVGPQPRRLQRARTLLALSVVTLGATALQLSGERPLLSLWDVSGLVLFGVSLVGWMTAITRPDPS